MFVAIVFFSHKQRQHFSHSGSLSQFTFSALARYPNAMDHLTDALTGTSGSRGVLHFTFLDCSGMPYLYISKELLSRHRCVSVRYCINMRILVLFAPERI